MARRKCPDKEELDGLIYALNDPTLDTFIPGQRPQKKERKTHSNLLESIGEKVREKNFKDLLEEYHIMQQWGETRVVAANNYARHYVHKNRVCDRCFHTYTNILSDNIHFLYHPTNEEMDNRRYLEILTKRVHRDLLGSNEIRKLLGRDFPFEW